MAQPPLWHQIGIRPLNGLTGALRPVMICCGEKHCTVKVGLLQSENLQQALALFIARCMVPMLE